MRFEVKTVKSIILDLNEDEAKWLKGVMQNPLNGKAPDEEDPIDKAIRYKFFGALKEFAPLNPMNDLENPLRKDGRPAPLPVSSNGTKTNGIG